MRIARQGGQITIRDRPGPYWALGVFLLIGGLIAIAMPLGLASDTGDLQPWERAASIGVGLGVSAAALWYLARNPASRVELDLTRRRLRLVRSGLRRRQVHWVSFDDLATAELERSTDSDGDPVWRPAVRLRTGDLLPLSELWSHDKAEVEEAVTAVAEGCRLRRWSEKPIR